MFFFHKRNIKNNKLHTKLMLQVRAIRKFHCARMNSGQSPTARYTRNKLKKKKQGGGSSCRLVYVWLLWTGGWVVGVAWVAEWNKVPSRGPTYSRYSYCVPVFWSNRSLPSLRKTCTYRVPGHNVTRFSEAISDGSISSCREPYTQWHRRRTSRS